MSTTDPCDEHFLKHNDNRPQYVCSKNEKLDWQKEQWQAHYHTITQEHDKGINEAP